MVKNLSQLKKAIAEKKEFVIVKHYTRPEYEGQIRRPNVVQTNGFYSIIPDEPGSKVTLANNGKGSWIEFGKASDWKFEDGVCKYTYKCAPFWEIKFL